MIVEVASPPRPAPNREPCGRETNGGKGDRRTDELRRTLCCTKQQGLVIAARQSFELDLSSEELASETGELLRRHGDVALAFELLAAQDESVAVQV